MAENKKSFLLYTDFANVFYELTNDEAGRLIKHLFRYVNDENPIMEDRLLKIVFEPIKMQLKRDLKQWEQTLEGKSEGGSLGNLKRWNNDLYLKVIKKKITIEQAVKIAKDRKVSVCDDSDRTVSLPVASVAVNDTVNVNDMHKRDLCLKILSDFGFNQIANQNKLTDISTFINLLSFEKRLDYFEQQYNSYWPYKKKSGEKSHGLESFLNGGWDSCNWAEKAGEGIVIINGQQVKDESTNKDLFKI